ncbi:DNA-directed 5'-3' RNA polymerase [Aureococcus anophagefferens]|nr:DNA-directed 5'-3' RNA polymerase [Aureococcus anophagefferens]
MIACLGQQAVDGKRIQNGFVQRTLPHWRRGPVRGLRRTVRNSEKNIVQFTYGDDGLDPVKMETGDSMPVDFGRLLHRVRHDDAAPRRGAATDALSRPRRCEPARRRRPFGRLGPSPPSSAATRRASCGT